MRMVKMLSRVMGFSGLVRIGSLFFLSVLSGSAFSLVVLQYHHVSTETPSSTSISPALFAEHLQFLENEKFSVISIETLPALLDEARKTGAHLPDKTAIITFDDGYGSIYEHAWPLLKKRGWPAAVFVNSQPHDVKNPRYMSWAQLREMSKGGVTIANHSDSHPHFLRRREGESLSGWQQRREAEIAFAQKRIQKEIGRAVKMYAHTYGEYDEALLKHLSDKGYLAFGQQSGPLSLESHPQLLPRFPFGGVYGGDDLAAKLYSLPFPKLTAMVQDSQGRLLVNPELPLGEHQPVLTLSSPILRFSKQAQCFASGQGAMAVQLKGSSLVARPAGPLPVGRSRYNCTVHAGGGRFYWYSHVFIRRLNSGAWYQEY
ncbi:polysaccharide deacetylase family protein [Teredinibacter purpureus]|uniref:polysaccharide deacetylase family protein n=1 Tax=Teredinibacter purpureus TaxID=2731756 RepID=UPI0013C4A480|nr:polysaccharide deacetylase family protein [Teredinibacter purpureus]